MNCFQSLTAVMALVLVPMISIAQDDEVTMEIIESLDVPGGHHRIQLPNRVVSQDVLDMKMDKVGTTQQERKSQGASHSVQLNELNELIAESEKAASIPDAKSVIADKEQVVDGAKIQEGMANYRKEIADRRQDLVDELKDDQTADMPAASIVSPDSAKALH